MAQQRGRGPSDPALGSLLRAVINKQASDEAVREAATKVEAYIAENESARKELARIVNTVVNSGKIENYGTATAQQILRKWLDELSDKQDASSDDKKDDDKKDDDAKDEV